MKDFLWLLFHPPYWMMNCDYSKEWDEWLNAAMKKEKFRLLSDGFHARICGATIWIRNHPYDSFTAFIKTTQLWDNRFTVTEVRPSRITIRNAMRKLEEEKKNNYGCDSGINSN